MNFGIGDLPRPPPLGGQYEPIPFLKDDEYLLVEPEQIVETKPAASTVKEAIIMVENSKSKKKPMKLAHTLLMYRLKIEYLAILILAGRNPKVCEALGITDDFKLRVMTSRGITKDDFPGVAKNRLTVHGLEQSGFRFGFEPEDGTTPLLRECEESGLDSFLDFIIRESAISTSDPSVLHVTNMITDNTKRHLGFMKLQTSQNLLRKADVKIADETPHTTRDLRNFVETLPETYPENLGFCWEMARRVMAKAFDKASRLSPDQIAKSSRDTSLWLPELCDLDDEERACVEAVFEKHEDLFVEFYGLLESGEMQPQMYDALPTFGTDGIVKLPTLPRTDGKMTSGPVILRVFRYDIGSPAESVAVKAVRHAVALGIKNNEQLRSAPRITLRLQGEGQFFAEFSTEDLDLDGRPFAVAIRRKCIEARRDLTPGTKKKLLDAESEELLGEVNTPAFTTRGKSSLVVLSPSRHQIFNAPDTALPLSNEEVVQTFVDVLENSRK
ncbi:MAG: hypothetical protein WCJ29_06075 [bacterium]